MPLTKTGNAILNKMERPPSEGGYGKKEGKSVFYASINKGKAGSSKWHGKKKIGNALRDRLTKGRM